MQQCEGASIVFLQAWVQLLETHAFGGKESVQSGALAWKRALNFRPHVVRARPCQHRLAGEMQPVHRVQRPAIEVARGRSASILKEFIEQVLHHQECRA